MTLWSINNQYSCNIEDSVLPFSHTFSYFVFLVFKKIKIRKINHKRTGIIILIEVVYTVEHCRFFPVIGETWKTRDIGREKK